MAGGVSSCGFLRALLTVYVSLVFPDHLPSHVQQPVGVVENPIMFRHPAIVEALDGKWCGEGDNVHAGGTPALAMPLT